MLNDRLLSAAARALRPGGTLTIVTDSAFYADLLLDVLARHPFYEPVRTCGGEGGSDTGGDCGGSAAQRTHAVKIVRARNGFELLSARPGPWCGHAADASSYFDRLWQTGLSVHSESHDRFVLHVRAAVADSSHQGAEVFRHQAERSVAQMTPSLPAAVAVASTGNKRARPDESNYKGDVDTAATHEEIHRNAHAKKKKKRKKKKSEHAS